jgi:hypothetical protein
MDPWVNNPLHRSTYFPQRDNTCICKHKALIAEGKVEEMGWDGYGEFENHFAG